ncbi:MAG TPA: glycosyltransferase family 1 protein [Chloroflexi bacterium]|nr:glycosyltransferase family 1 protein [Chloroflexota bacterium]
MNDQPLRFCMITTFYPPYNFGGDGIFVHHLSNELARRGHHVEVIHCVDSYRMLGGQDPVGVYDDHPRVTVHGLKSPFGFLSPLATQQTGFPWFKAGPVRRILERPFDVINYHNISLVGGPKVLELGRAIKLYTMHEYWLVCPTHVLFRFNREACTRRNCFICQIAYRRPPQMWRYSGLLQKMAAHVDAFISPSRYTMDKHRSLGFNFPMVHLPSFVASPEPASLSRDDGPGEGEAEPYFLFVGRLEKLKGVQTLIPIFRDYPEARLLIAGSGGYEPHLRQLAGGSRNVRFLGHLTGARLQGLYERAVALIAPSLCYEVFSLVIAEAFSQRTPVIARNLGASAEIVERSGGGLLYDTEDELRQAVNRLVGDSSYRRELGQRGYEAYQQNWTVEAYLERYLSLVAELADRRSGRSSHASAGFEEGHGAGARGSSR